MPSSSGQKSAYSKAIDLDDIPLETLRKNDQQPDMVPDRYEESSDDDASMFAE